MRLKERVDKAFHKYGEEFLVNGIIQVKGFFQRMDSAGIREFFSFGDQDSVPESALVLMTPADAAVSVGDSVDRIPHAYTVSKLTDKRVENILVMRMMLLE